MFKLMEKHREKKKYKKGFTLIELIVVIAILGILAALAIPRLSGLQDNANKKAILGNLKTLDSAVEVYAADNNVAFSAVTKANLEAGLVPNWPVGPKSTTIYSIASGVATATLSADIPGVAIGTYTSSSATLQ